MLTDSFIIPPTNYRWFGGIFFCIYGLFLSSYIYVLLTEPVGQCSDDYVRNYYFRLTLFALLVALALSIIITNNFVLTATMVLLPYILAISTWFLATNGCQFDDEIVQIILVIDYWFHFIVFIVTVVVIVLMCVQYLCG